MRPSARARFAAKIDRNGPIPAHCPELGPCHVWTAQKGRAKPPDNRGERHGMSKITDDVARAIKVARLSGRVSQRELADRFRVSQSLVSAILLGKRWGHVHVEGGR